MGQRISLCTLLTDNFQADLHCHLCQRLISPPTALKGKIILCLCITISSQSVVKKPLAQTG